MLNLLLNTSNHHHMMGERDNSIQSLFGTLGANSNLIIIALLIVIIIFIIYKNNHSSFTKKIDEYEYEIKTLKRELKQLKKDNWKDF